MNREDFQSKLADDPQFQETFAQVVSDEVHHHADAYREDGEDVPDEVVEDTVEDVLNTVQNALSF